VGALRKNQKKNSLRRFRNARSEIFDSIFLKEESPVGRENLI